MRKLKNQKWLWAPIIAVIVVILGIQAYFFKNYFSPSKSTSNAETSKNNAVSEVVNSNSNQTVSVGSKNSDIDQDLKNTGKNLQNAEYDDNTANRFLTESEPDLAY